MFVTKVFLITVVVGMVLAGPAAEKKEPVPTAEEFEATIKGCQKIYPIEDGEVKDLKKFIIKENPDRLQKCYVYCIMKKNKMLSDDGKFDVERIYDITISKHKDLKEDPLNAIKECIAKSTQKHICEKAFASKKCIADKKIF